MFVDLDVGNDSTGKYPSKQAARQSLDAFIASSGVPPPVIMDSGTGLWGIWLFDTGVPVSDWKPFARQFKSYCQGSGLKIDPSVTADAARVMRCPGTYNFKTAPPSRTAILSDEIYVHDWAIFCRWLEHACGMHVVTGSATQERRQDDAENSNKPALGNLLKDAPKGVDEDTRAVAGPDPTAFPPSPENVAWVIAALDKYLEAGKGRDNASWYEVLCQLRNLHAQSHWTDEIAYALFDAFSVKAGGNYDAEQNRARWDSPDSALNDFSTLDRLLRGVDSPGARQPEQPTSKVKRAFTFLKPSDLDKMPPLKWWIHQILQREGIASIYAAPNVGKTAVGLDMAAHIASGIDWFGYAVTAAPVIYVALEGAHGLRQRAKAWEIHNGRSLPDSLCFVFDHLSLFRDGSVEEFARAVLHEQRAGGVIFIDTLNRAAPEADENTSQGMGQVIAKAMALATYTQCSVVLVHHAGKDQSKGLRGHSSLHAALDTAIEIKKDATGLAWSLTKSKDSQTGCVHGFELKTVVVGQDDAGVDVTSIAVNPLPGAGLGRMLKRRAPTGVNQQLALKEINVLIQRSTSGRILLEDAIKAAGAVLACDSSHRRGRATSAINSLIAAGYIEHKDDVVWRT